MRKSVIKKQSQVEQLKDRLLEAKTVVAFDDLGMTVKQSTDLRVALYEENCAMTVYKNNISRRALELAGFGELSDEFVGRKVLVFSNDDVVAPARIVHEFARKTKKVKLEVGVIEGKAASREEILELATLPSYETLLTQLAAGLFMPLRELAVGLNMMTEEQQEQEA